MDKIFIKCDCTDCNGHRQTGICNYDIYYSEISITTTTPNKSTLRKRKNSSDKNEIK